MQYIVSYEHINSGTKFAVDRYSNGLPYQYGGHNDPGTLRSFTITKVVDGNETGIVPDLCYYSLSAEIIVGESSLTYEYGTVETEMTLSKLGINWTEKDK